MLTQRLCQPLSYLKQCQMQFCRVQQELYRSVLQPHAHREISDILCPIFAQKLPPQQKTKCAKVYCPVVLYWSQITSSIKISGSPLAFWISSCSYPALLFWFQVCSHVAKKTILNQHLSVSPELLVSKHTSDGTVGKAVWSFPCACRRSAFAALRHMIST